MTSADHHPGVSDSIELHNGEANSQASDEQRLLGKRAMQYPSMGDNAKRGVQMATSRVMGTGMPQGLAMRWSNAHRAKVLTVCRPSRNEPWSLFKE